MPNGAMYQKVIKNALGVLKLVETLGDVSQACKMMVRSRDSFYRYKELYENGGGLAPQVMTRKKPCLKNRENQSFGKVVVDFVLEKSAYGQLRVCNELKKQGILIFPGGICSVWLR